MTRSYLGPFKQPSVVTTTLFLCLAGVPCRGEAQTALTGLLGRLLTEQAPTTPDLPVDAQAAADTASTVAGLVAVELATLPTASSAGGFAYRINPSLGLVERGSEAFGPAFAETVLRNGRGQSSFSVKYLGSSFTSLQGQDLSSGTFPTNAIRLTGTTTPIAIDALSLRLETRTLLLVGNYGISDRLTVGAQVPVNTVTFSGQRVRVQGGASTTQSIQSGSASGLGDIALESRYRLTGRGSGGLMAGADVRLPTGRAESLLGTGRAALRAIAIGSFEQGQLAVHLNGGGGVGGASRELFWNAATTFAPTPHVTLIGEVMGRHLFQLATIQDVYQPILGQPGLESMRWLPVAAGVSTTYLATGAKWNLRSNWLLNTSLLVRVTDAGLRARVTPTVAMEYSFQR